MIRTAILVVWLTCAAYAQDAAAPAIALEWGKPSGGLRLSLSSDKKEYRPGEPIRVTAILRNVSDVPIRVTSTSIWLFYEMEVLAPAPEWLPFRPRASRTPLAERNLHLEVTGMGGIRLTPGLQTRQEFEVNTLFQMTDPGVYHITFAHRERPNDRGQPDIRVISNDLKVTILADQE